MHHRPAAPQLLRVGEKPAATAKLPVKPVVCIAEVGWGNELRPLGDIPEQLKKSFYIFVFLLGLCFRLD